VTRLKSTCVERTTDDWGWDCRGEGVCFCLLLPWDSSLLLGSHVSRDGLFFLEPFNPSGVLVGDWVLSPPPPWSPLSFSTLELPSRLLSNVCTPLDRSHIRMTNISERIFYSDSVHLVYSPGWAPVPPTPSPSQRLTAQIMHQNLLTNVYARHIAPQINVDTLW